jgi:hypothetical protein
MKTELENNELMNDHNELFNNYIRNESKLIKNKSASLKKRFENRFREAGEATLNIGGIVSFEI